MTDSKHRYVLQLTLRGRTETESSGSLPPGLLQANLVSSNDRLLVASTCLFPFHLIFIVTMFLFSQANSILPHACRIEFFRFMTRKLSSGRDVQASSCRSAQPFSRSETARAYKELPWQEPQHLRATQAPKETSLFPSWENHLWS